MAQKRWLLFGATLALYDMSPEEEKKIERLERKVRREQSAREQAERIAEDGMRRLFIANQELDERVSERTEELETERATAAQSAAERAEFLRLLSRETRSPLNGVLGVMEVASGNAQSEQMRAWLEDGLASARDLEGIMTRLLLFLELDGPNTVEVRTIDVSSVLSDVDSRWKHKAVRAGLLLATDNRCRGEGLALGHRPDLDAILDELIANAIKHGQPGLLRIAAEEADDSEDNIVFSVTDAGPGIEDVSPLLDPTFYDWSNTQARGMGYSLVKRLAGRTAAELDIDSALGEPTRVSVTLPFAQQRS